MTLNSDFESSVFIEVVPLNTGPEIIENSGSEVEKWENA